MQTIKNMWKKDWTPRLFWALVVCVFATKALLGAVQYTYVWVGGAPLDDELMWRAAQSITAGQWLGPYDWLTLSKQMFFAVWLAFCHLVGVPYLVAGQLLWCAASLAMAMAFAPVLARRRTRFLLFAALAFNPAAAAAFTLRVYRDNIFPAECVLFFAGMVGLALRCLQPVRRTWPWLLLAGVGLGLAKITREDGVWLLPFAIVGTALICVWILLEKGLPRKALRLALQCVPYGVMGACVLVICCLNWQHYGLFATSDFSEGSFAAAYGAMTRLTSDSEELLVPVPEDVRTRLYQAVPALQPLAYWLEEDDVFKNGYQQPELQDYTAGSFYWALRRAAAQEGVYDTAQTAQAYWAQVAQAINSAVDEGVLSASYGERASTAPIIKGEHVLPTLWETVYNVYYCATFQNCGCYNVWDASLVTAEDAAQWTAYLGSAPNVAVMENTTKPYYSPLQHAVYSVFNALRCVYAVLVPVLLVWALWRQWRGLGTLLRHKRTRELRLWIILFGLLGMALLRCAMIAFMEVAAFNIGTSVMYLSTVHPLLITYAVVGSVTGPLARKWAAQSAHSPDAHEIEGK